MEGNLIAAIALMVWPFAALIFYLSFSFSRATIWTILGGMLVLPAGGFVLKIPMIPGFDKSSVPNLCVAFACLFFKPPPTVKIKRSMWVTVLLSVYFASPLVTSLMNSDAVVIGDQFLPGVGIYDAISAVLGQGIFFLSFFIGRAYFYRSYDIVLILRALVIAGLIYSIPVLFEIRMSPQLSNWIYGYLPGGFVTVVRYGGYRPVVFMDNGLVLAFFMATCLLAAVAMRRLKLKVTSVLPGAVAPYLALINILCKSTGALIYLLLFTPVVYLWNPKAQIRVAVILAGLGLIYPVLRYTDIFPTKALVDFTASLTEERAQSLETRFNNEDQLLAKASERPLFGWGRFGRSRVYDAESGKDESLTDGFWIIVLGQFGLVGFLAVFGLLAVPVFGTLSIPNALLRGENILLGTLALIVALTIVEQLPNASVTPWTWFLTGALLGRSEFLKAENRRSRFSSVKQTESLRDRSEDLSQRSGSYSL